MNGIAAKQKRQQGRKVKQKEQAQRKAKVYKGLVLAHRRQMDRARRARQRRERREHTWQWQREFRFRVVEEMQADLDRFLIYNNYRLHSSLGWKAPVTRFTGRVVGICGLAGILGLEPMAADPQ